jgi:transcriptional regulator GlxA family with amidase domain
MRKPTVQRLISVDLVALPDTAPGTLYSLCEVFSSVSTGWQELTGEPGRGRGMTPRIVAQCDAPFDCALGAPIAPGASFARAARADIVIVSDLVLSPDFDPRGRWPEAVAWLRNQFDDGATVCSVCTGSVLLAEAGLLDGLEATTHWAAAGIFGRFYPRVRLKPDRVLLSAGPEGRVMTSGGAASWADLALHLIAQFCGRQEAVRTAKIFLLGDRSDGQLPFAALTKPRQHDDAIVERCQTWIAEHYDAPSPVTRMVAQSGLATRTFKRRFRAATGFTPIEYVQTLRIEEAKQLLENTSMPTDEVGPTIGYDDPASFRRIFKRVAGVTPARYRRRYRSVGDIA